MRTACFCNHVANDCNRLVTRCTRDARNCAGRLRHSTTPAECTAHHLQKRLLLKRTYSCEIMAPLGAKSRQGTLKMHHVWNYRFPGASESTPSTRPPAPPTVAPQEGKTANAKLHHSVDISTEPGSAPNRGDTKRSTEHSGSEQTRAQMG